MTIHHYLITFLPLYNNVESYSKPGNTILSMFVGATRDPLQVGNCLFFNRTAGCNLISSEHMTYNRRAI